jgi:parallel beta-helix repeat protein
MGLARRDQQGTVRTLRVAAAALGVAGLVAVGSGEALAAVECGDTITQDRKLTKDIVNCDVTGLIIGAPGVTLDLNGHRLDGIGESNDGVLNSAGHDGVVIKGSGGKITGFGRGVEMNNAADARVKGIKFRNIDSATSAIGVFMSNSSNALVTNNVVTDMKDPDAVGILLQGGSQAEVSGNEITSIKGQSTRGVRLALNSLGVLVERNRIAEVGGHGIDVDGSDSARILRNRVSRTKLRGILITGDADGTRVKRNNLIRNEDGLLLDGSWTGSDARISANTARLSLEDGLELDAAGVAVRRNLVLNNADWGIEADPGTIDLGGNRAAGNGEAAQCLNVVCTPP